VLSYCAAIEGLLKLGILQGDKEDILKTRTSVAFFPHGLGHYLGMDTVRLILVLIYSLSSSQPRGTVNCQLSRDAA
jgi:hypothetical protein